MNPCEKRYNAYKKVDFKHISNGFNTFFKTLDLQKASELSTQLNQLSLLFEKDQNILRQNIAKIHKASYVSLFSENGIGFVTFSNGNEHAPDKYSYLVNIDGDIISKKKFHTTDDSNFVHKKSMIYHPATETFSYIGEDGNDLFNAEKFESANPFYDGIALVEKEHQRFFYIDENGKELFDELTFSEDHTIEIENGFDSGGPFSHGIAYATIGDRTYFFDTKGNVVYDDTNVNDVKDYDGSGYLRIQMKHSQGDRYWHYIDIKTHDIFHSTKDPNVHSFKEGYLPAKLPGEEQYVFLDKHKQPMYPRNSAIVQCKQASSFYNSIACIQRRFGEKYQYITTDKQFAFSGEEFDFATPMYDGFSYIYKNKTHYILHKNGDRYEIKTEKHIDHPAYINGLFEFYDENFNTVYVNKYGEIMFND